MASTAHCFLCFETLSANFEHREPLKLDDLLNLYENYKTVTGTSLDTGDGTGEEDEEDFSRDVEDSDGDTGADEGRTKLRDTHPQLPSISRIQASTSSSRSSSTSTPTSTSANSSTSHLTGSTSTSTATSVTSSRPSYSSRLSLTDSYPLFVTWNTVSRSGHTSLRGCIGTFESVSLASGLPTYALASAFDDTRFSPIPASLLSALTCSITLLANFEPCDNAMDWILGRHGLRISFTYRGRRHGATYLPHVATEQGWTKEETVESLMRKAGWDGGYGHGVARRLLRGSARSSGDQPQRPWDEVTDFRAVKYTGLTAGATYSQWKEWRDWVGKQTPAVK